MSDEEIELRISRAAQDRIAVWVQRELSSHARHGLIAAALFVLLALLANVAVYFALLFTLYKWLFRTSTGDPMTLAALVPLGLLGLIYPVYFIWHRPPVSRTLVTGGCVRIPVDKQQALALVSTGESSELNTDRWRADFLLFPAWLTHMAVQHIAAPLQAMRANADSVARVLTTLLIVHRRIGLYELDDRVQDAQLARALAALRHLPGVIFWHRDEVSVSLNQELRQTLAAMT
jgi:hypothetical protein